MGVVCSRVYHTSGWVLADGDGPPARTRSRGADDEGEQRELQPEVVRKLEGQVVRYETEKRETQEEERERERESSEPKHDQYCMQRCVKRQQHIIHQLPGWKQVHT